ncbi:hypothetical protein M436DRAFT_52738 [Aureobasidium namibiae CBS 147.97]|uniref:Uncharacterized protein n=1 Tax=Aureobasidium namibiae CBS 147.97 TaxID=1043004 RepID=A0A074WC38_9PEZI
MKLSLAIPITLASISHVLAVSATQKADAGKCYPLDTTFQLNVPHSLNGLPPINYAGYIWRLPKATIQGNLVSFFGNFHNNQTTSSQVTTVTNSTSASDGSSMSSASSAANGTTVVSTTFSSGNASSAAGAAQGLTSNDSSSSSGNANSTAISTAAGDVSIVTNATVASASNAQSVQNERQAAAATSCAAENEHASASANEITTVTFTSANGTRIGSVAYAACSAGVVAPSTADGVSSSSGSQASVGGVSATVTCDGSTTTVSDGNSSYAITVRGVYCQTSGFSGAIVGQRVAHAEAEC